MKKELLVAAGVGGLLVTILGGFVAPRVLAQGDRAVDRAIVNSIVQVGGKQIGASVRDVTAAEATSAKLTAPAGAFVRDVTVGGPAATAGLRAGDIILSFDGERVRSASHLVRLVGETAEGRAVDAVLSRGGEQVTIRITPDGLFDASAGRLVLPEIADIQDRIQRALPVVPEIRLGAGRLGVSVQELTPQLASYFGVTDGVLVASVTAGSPAASAGLKAGDVITSVNGTAVATTTALRRGVAQASTDVTLTVMRDRKEMSIKVAVGPARVDSRTTA